MQENGASMPRGVENSQHRLNFNDGLELDKVNIEADEVSGCIFDQTAAGSQQEARNAEETGTMQQKKKKKKKKQRCSRRGRRGRT